MGQESNRHPAVVEHAPHVRSRQRRPAALSQFLVSATFTQAQEEGGSRTRIPLFGLVPTQQSVILISSDAISGAGYGHQPQGEANVGPSHWPRAAIRNSPPPPKRRHRHRHLPQPPATPMSPPPVSAPPQTPPPPPASPPNRGPNRRWGVPITHAGPGRVVEKDRERSGEHLIDKGARCTAREQPRRPVAQIIAGQLLGSAARAGWARIDIALQSASQ